MSAHSEFACAHDGCMAIICLTPEQEARFRENHKPFSCPMGHTQGFYGKNANEKRIEQLELQLAQSKRLAHYRSAQVAELRAELRSAYARIGAKTRKLKAVA